jgi:hypothetical protein
VTGAGVEGGSELVGVDVFKVASLRDRPGQEQGLASRGLLVLAALWLVRVRLWHWTVGVADDTKSPITSGPNMWAFTRN